MKMQGEAEPPESGAGPRGKPAKAAGARRSPTDQASLLPPNYFTANTFAARKEPELFNMPSPPAEPTTEIPGADCKGKESSRWSSHFSNGELPAFTTDSCAVLDAD